MKAHCKHLLIGPDKDGKVRLRKERRYRCMVDVPTPVLPASVTKAFDWRWPPHKSNVGIEDCAKCPFFEARGET